MLVHLINPAHRLRALALLALSLTLLACTPAQASIAPSVVPAPVVEAPPVATVAQPTTAFTLPAASPIPPPTNPPLATATASALTYAVQSGDTLFAIALAYGVTLESLQIVNDLAGDTIFPGQVLIIPSGTVVPPTPVESPTYPAFLTVISFTAGPSPADRGAQVTVSWEVAYASEVTVWPMAFDRKTGRWSRLTEVIPGATFDAPVTDGAATGQWTGRVPAYARYPFRFELEALDIEGRLVEAETEDVELFCHPSISGRGYCPLAPQTVEAEYQAFQFGHLIWRADTGRILIIPANPGLYVPWSLEAPLPARRPIADPPAGLLPPAQRFAGLWSSLSLQASDTTAATPGVQPVSLGDLLGWATAPEAAYLSTIQLDLDNTQSGISNDALLVTLPDSRVAVLTLYGGAQGVNGPAWALVEP